MFSVDLTWVTAWNNEDLTTTLEAGSRFMVSVTSAYTSNAYCQLRITSYSDKAVYYVARSGSVWQTVRKVSFANTDTKNTAGSTNTNSKIYLIGATSQADNPVTYSQNTVFADADGVLNVQKLNINTTDGTPQIKMSRTSNNYIQIPAEGRLCICPSDTLGLETSTLQVSATDVHPGTTTINLGTSTYKWNNVYAKTFRGDIIAPAKVTTPLISSASNTALNIAPSSTLYLKSGASSSLIFSPQGTERARFDTSGNFLIKTLMYPAPTNTLDLGSSTYKWKSVYATTFEGDLDGNAATATKLKSAFTLSLAGAAGGSVTIDGSQNRTLTVNGIKEAYLSWGGKNFSGNCGPLDAALHGRFGADRLAFADPAGITIEYSTDSGVTWTEYPATNAEKQSLFGSAGVTQSFRLGNNTTANSDLSTMMLRVTLNTGLAKIYTTLNKFAIYVSTNRATDCYCTIQKALESTPDTYVTVVENVPISGWSGWNIINTSGITTYGNQASSQYGRVRFIFGCAGGTANTQYFGMNVQNIMGFGGMGHTTPSNLAKHGHLYNWNENQDAIFPAQVTAKSFSGSGASLTSLPAGQLTGIINAARLPAATTTTQGALSAADKIKLDGLEATISITDAEIDAICTSTLEVDSTLVDEVTGTSYRLYVSEGNLKMAEVNK